MRKFLVLFILSIVPYSISISSFKEFNYDNSYDDFKPIYLLRQTIFDEYLKNIQDPLVKAIIYVESYNGKYMYNGLDQGWMQQRPINVDDVNRIIDKIPFKIYHYKKFTKKDRFNLDKSIRMWYIWQEYYNPQYDAKLAATLWNGGFKYKNSKQALIYWDKVKKIMLIELAKYN